MFEQSPRRERERGGRGLPWREHKGMVPRMHRAPLSGLLHVVFRETPSEWWQPRQGRGGPGQSCLPVRGGFSSPSPPRLQETDLAQFSKAMCTPVRASWALRRHEQLPGPPCAGRHGRLIPQTCTGPAACSSGFRRSRGLPAGGADTLRCRGQLCSCTARGTRFSGRRASWEAEQASLPLRADTHLVRWLPC